MYESSLWSVCQQSVNESLPNSHGCFEADLLVSRAGHQSRYENDRGRFRGLMNKQALIDRVECRIRHALICPHGCYCKACIMKRFDVLDAEIIKEAISLNIVQDPAIGTIQWLD